MFKNAYSEEGEKGGAERWRERGRERKMDKEGRETEKKGKGEGESSIKKSEGDNSTHHPYSIKSGEIYAADISPPHPTPEIYASVIDDNFL